MPRGFNITLTMLYFMDSLTCLDVSQEFLFFHFSETQHLQVTSEQSAGVQERLHGLQPGLDSPGGFQEGRSGPGLATDTQSFLLRLSFFVKKSCNCLEGKSVTPHQGDYYSLLFLPATPSTWSWATGWLLKRTWPPSRALNLASYVAS